MRVKFRDLNFKMWRAARSSFFAADSPRVLARHTDTHTAWNGAWIPVRQWRGPARNPELPRCARPSIRQSARATEHAELLHVLEQNGVTAAGPTGAIAD
jgi:hypothetical protein